MLVIIILILLIICCNKKTIEYYGCKLPRFLPKIWNSTKDYIKRYNNCYAYSMRDLRKNMSSKPQPGDKCGLNRITKKEYHNNNICDKFFNRIKCDYSENNNNFFKINKKDKCPCNYYKIALFIDDTKGNEDYHFYRQDDDNLWSHKPGKNLSTKYDASNKLIIDPDKSDRKFPNYNYSKLCGYYCNKYIDNEFIDK